MNRIDPTGYAWGKANCYGYAVGKNEDLLPGGTIWSGGSVTDLYNLVKQDFDDGKFKRNDGKSGNAKIRAIALKTSKIKKDEYRIAMRVSNVEVYFPGPPGTPGVKDFHFWKQNRKNGKWYNKHGTKKVQALGEDKGTYTNGNPDNTFSKGWLRRKNHYGKGIHLRYDEPTKYAAIKGIKFKK